MVEMPWLATGGDGGGGGGVAVHPTVAPPPQKTAMPVRIWTTSRKKGIECIEYIGCMVKRDVSKVRHRATGLLDSAPALYCDMIRLVRPMSIYRPRVTHGDAAIAATDVLHASDHACPFVLLIPSVKILLSNNDVV